MDTNWFIDVLEKNEMLPRSQIDLLKFSLTDETVPGKAVQQLENDNFISKWQHERLLAGIEKFRIGEYKLVDLMGTDEFGEVYLAVRQNGEFVRLRLMAKHISSDSVERKRFIERVMTFHQLDDLPMARIVDLFESDNRLFVASANPEGKSLSEYSKKDKLKKKHIESILRTLVQAMAKIESAGMFHGSIQTQTVFLSNTGNVELDLPKDIGWSPTSFNDIEPDAIQFGRLASQLVGSPESPLASINQPPLQDAHSKQSGRESNGSAEIDRIDISIFQSLMTEVESQSNFPPIPEPSTAPPAVPPPNANAVAVSSEGENGPPPSTLPEPPQQKPPEDAEHSELESPKTSYKFIFTVCALTMVIVVLSVLIVQQINESNHKKSVAKNADSKSSLSAGDETPEKSPESSGTADHVGASASTSDDDRAASPQKDDSTATSNKKGIDFQPKITPKDLIAKPNKTESTSPEATPTKNSPSPDKVKSGIEPKPETDKKENPIVIVGDQSNKPQPAPQNDLAKAKPFRDVPAFVQIPSPDDQKVKELFTVHLPPNFPVTARLLGGYFASPGKFEFNLRRSNSEENTWVVYAGPRGELKQVAQFTRSNQKICFQWKTQAKGLFYAKQLKNCGVTLKAGNQECAIALRATEIFPELQFAKALNATTQVKLVDPPNFEQVEIQILEIPKKLNGFFFEGGKKKFSGRADSVSLLHEFPNKDVFQLDLSSRYEQQLIKFRGASSVVVPNIRTLRLTTIKTLEEQAQQTIKDADRVIAQHKLGQDNGNKIPDDELKRQFFESPQFKELQAQAQLAPDLKDRASKYLAIGKKLDQARIGFRVIYKAGEMEIELARSTKAN